ncbi:MAG TPA: glycosyltransferase family 4 protein [Vicinamibacterales bacterium]|nr:glycosyltransferase family 4 protein [Vicinamibacterales bacterium]
MRPSRVLLLGPFPPPHGGVQTHLVTLRQFLRKSGVSCPVINITGHRKTETDDVYYPKHAIGLIRLLLQLKYDIIHLHFGGNLTLRLLALTLVCCLVPRVRTVLTFHSGGYPGSAAGKRARPWTLRGFVLRRLDRLIGVNAELVDMYRRFGVVPMRARFIAPHGSNDRPVLEAAVPESRFFASHGPVLLTVGGLEPEYDLPLQIEMLGLLRQTIPDAGLIIVGSGSLAQEIRDRIDATPYRDHVLLCGDVPHAETLQLIAKCDLLLRTTLYDGDSIAVREALLLGTPVLATDNGMRPAGVHLIAGARPDSLAVAVKECLQRPDRPEAVQCDERNLEAVLELYAELCGEPEKSLSSSTSVAG